jgi:hypothetical protein
MNAYMCASIIASIALVTLIAVTTSSPLEHPVLMFHSRHFFTLIILWVTQQYCLCPSFCVLELNITSMQLHLQHIFQCLKLGRS